jgi:uncharacterized protein YndB with AHSA1/START domain
MFTIDTSIDIAVPLARVRSAVTTEAGFRAWFAQDADFDGTQATFRFAQPSGLSRSVTLRVDRCDASGIVMTCTGHENNPDWVGTTLAIELGETPAGTKVRLVHSGYPAKNEVYERCTEAWSYAAQGRGPRHRRAVRRRARGGARLLLRARSGSRRGVRHRRRIAARGDRRHDGGAHGRAVSEAVRSWPTAGRRPGGDYAVTNLPSGETVF